MHETETTWQSLTVSCYEGKERQLAVASAAVCYHTGKPPVPIRWLLIRGPEGEFGPQALLSSDPDAEPLQIIEWFILRWRLEVTFQRVRLHLGVKTHRQWSDLAIKRIMPVLFGLFSLLTLAAHELYQQAGFAPHRAAWYGKPLLTFSDALAILRERLWRCSGVFARSASRHEMIKIPKPLLDRFVATLCYAA